MQSGGGKIEAHVWRIATVVVLGTIMSVLDTTIVNVALDTLGKDLHSSVDQIQWVVTGYLLALAAVIPVSGWASRRFSNRSVYMLSLVLFTAGSVLCGLAQSTESLVAFRVIQGIGGGMLVPTGQMILVRASGPKNLPKVMSAIGVPIVLAPIFGPTIGGLLLEHVSWQSIFLVNLPVGILAVVLGWFIIPRTPGHRGLSNDFVGILLFGASIVALVFPLIEGRTFGWPAWTWGMMAAALVGLALFVLWERRMAAADRPQLLNFSLLTNGNYVFGVFVTMIFASGIPGFFMVFSLLLQAGFGFTPLESGLTNTPFSVGVLVVSLISGRLGSRFIRARATVSALFLTSGMLWVHLIIAGLGDSISHWWFLPPLLLAGLGLGLGFSALFQAVLSTVPPRDAGAGSGALQAFQQVGGAIGVALVGQVFFSMLADAHDLGATSTQAAFAGAAAAATWYQVISFGLVLILVLLLRVKDPAAGPGSARTPAPAVGEA